jgi:hypothetical protein
LIRVKSEKQAQLPLLRTAAFWDATASDEMAEIRALWDIAATNGSGSECVLHSIRNKDPLFEATVSLGFASFPLLCHVK